MHKFSPDAPGLGSTQLAKDSSNAHNAYQRVLRTPGFLAHQSRPGAAFWRLAIYLQGRAILSPANPSTDRLQLDYYECDGLVPISNKGTVYLVDMRGSYLWALGNLQVDGKRIFRRTARWLTAARSATVDGSPEQKFIKSVYCQGLGQMADRGYGLQYAEVHNISQSRLRQGCEIVTAAGGTVLAVGRVDAICFFLPSGTKKPLSQANLPGCWKPLRHMPAFVYNSALPKLGGSVSNRMRSLEYMTRKEICA